MNSASTPGTPEEIKRCYASLYASDWVRWLLGDSYHPGGLALTERLGALLALAPDARVLDVVAGRGVSALYLAARAAAQQAGVGERVEFVLGDAEQLPCDDHAFDAMICECAYCTFPD